MPMKKEEVAILIVLASALAFALTAEEITINSPSQPYYDTNIIETDISLSETVSQINITINGTTYELCQNCNTGNQTLTLGDGQHTLLVTASNESDTVSKTHSFTIDTIPPSIDFDALTAPNDSTINNSLYIGVTIIEANIANITYALSNESGEINTTTFTTLASINYAGLNGTYFYYVSIVDKVGKSNTTETRRVVVNQVCTPNWIPQSTCNASDINFTSYKDTNACNTTSGMPSNTTTSCDFCFPSWIQANTSCTSNEKIAYYRDERNCYTQTNLQSDLQGMPSNKTYSCDTSSQQTTTPQNQNIPSTKKNTTTNSTNTTTTNTTATNTTSAAEGTVTAENTTTGELQSQEATASAPITGAAIGLSKIKPFLPAATFIGMVIFIASFVVFMRKKVIPKRKKVERSVPKENRYRKPTILE